MASEKNVVLGKIKTLVALSRGMGGIPLMWWWEDKSYHSFTNVLQKMLIVIKVFSVPFYVFLLGWET